MRDIKRYIAVICAFVILFSGFGIIRPDFAEADSAIDPGAIYTAPGAVGDGSFESPMDFEAALLAVEKGQTIYMLEGTYKYDHTILIAEENAGEAGNYKKLSAYPGAKVTLDFSAQACVSSNRGVILDGSYWHLYGISIYGAGDNGMLLAGDYNIIEMCIFEGNQDTGLQLSRNNTAYNKVEQWPSYNYILNCTSRNNHDPDGEDADGFAPKLTCGEGNVFDGCMAYNNVDDGWDCYAKSATGPIGQVTLINCIAFRNGQTEDGTFTADSDGNGFKLGGGGIGTPHVVINCLAFENKNCGFTDNNNPTAISLINCTAFNNNLSGKKYNYNVYRCRNANCINVISYSKSGAKDAFQNTFASNLIYYNGKKWFKVTSYMALDSKDSAKQGEQISTGLTAADFVVTESPALGTDFHTLWRDEDGSLNTHGYAMISPESSYATFSTDGKTAGARFGDYEAGFEVADESGYEKTHYFTSSKANVIKEAAIAGTVPDFSAIPSPTPVPTSAPTLSPTPKPEATPTPSPTLTNTPIPTVTAVMPEATASPKATEAPESTPTGAPVSSDEAKDGLAKYMPVIVIVAVIAGVGVGVVVGRKRK